MKMRKLFLQFHVIAMLGFLPLSTFAQTTLGIDESCMQEIKQTSTRCSSAYSDGLSCVKQKLAPECRALYEAHKGMDDPNCKQSVLEAATSCSKAAKTSSQKCMAQNLSPRCAEQFTKAQDNLQVCQLASQKIIQSCKAAGDSAKQMDCLKQKQPELKSVCPN